MKKYPNTDKIKVYIGSKLRNARIEAGYSQQALGKELGLTHGAIGSYERGRLSLTIQLLLRYCVILKKPLSYFISHEHEEDLDAESKKILAANIEIKNKVIEKYDLKEDLQFEMEFSIRSFLKSRGIRNKEVLIEKTDEIMKYILSQVL